MARTKGTRKRHLPRSMGGNKQQLSRLTPLPRKQFSADDSFYPASLRRRVGRIVEKINRLMFCGPRFIPSATIDYCIYEPSFQHVGRDHLYTATFAAIMHRISTVEDEAIWKFRERVVEWYLDRETVEAIYEVIQDDVIHIEPHVFVQALQSTEAVPTTSEGKSTDVKIKTLRVMSDTKPTGYLKETVERWFKDYENHKDMAQQTHQMIFMMKFDSKGTESLMHRPFDTYRDFTNLIFPGKSEVLEEIDFFLNNQAWYEERGLPYSLGLLLHGPPGCGKTSFIKAILKYTKRHGIVLTVNHFADIGAIEKLMRNDSLCEFPIPQNKRLYIMEDIDAMGDLVSKRQPWDDDAIDKAGDGEALGEIKQERFTEDPLRTSLFAMLNDDFRKTTENSLAALLRMLDGVIECPGRILVMTTNHVDKLDPALIRPGRIDIRLQFTSCTREAVCEIVQQFYEVGEEAMACLNRLKDYLVTPAELAQLCKAHKNDFDGLIAWLLKLNG
eukprot:GHVN01002443.1.p1 GENE.GHVN01002443.1~~GHVN01002443.1.p1  ORF type:complete len:500 (-),score=64.11 GHVN01002443.1:835-2334(-)